MMRAPWEPWTRSSLLWLSLFAFSGCIILENNPQRIPIPVPQPLPEPYPGPFPGSGELPDPGTDVLFLVRVDRGTANLASSYELLVQDTLATLEEAGLTVRTVAVGSLYMPRLLWADGPTSPARAPLTDTLRYYAGLGEVTAPASCTTTALSTLAPNLSTQSVAYPQELSGPAGPFRPFFDSATAFLTVMIDSGPRPLAHDATDCLTEGLTPARHFGVDPSAWLTLRGDVTLSRAQTRFLFISTPERVSDDALRAGCLAAGELPPGGLDAMAASPLPFFETFSAQLNEQKPQLAAHHELCHAFGGKWVSSLRPFFKSWVDELKTLAPPPPATPPGSPESGTPK